jgi:hypothetical protein
MSQCDGAIPQFNRVELFESCRRNMHLLQKILSTKLARTATPHNRAGQPIHGCLKPIRGHELALGIRAERAARLEYFPRH